MEGLELKYRSNRFDARSGTRFIGLSSRGARDPDGAIRRAAALDKYATTDRQHAGDSTKAAQGFAWLSFRRKRQGGRAETCGCPSLVRSNFYCVRASEAITQEDLCHAGSIDNRHSDLIALLATTFHGGSGSDQSRFGRERLGLERSLLCERGSENPEERERYWCLNVHRMVLVSC